MNRRILLIDADTQFRSTLATAVQRYRVEIVHEPDADEAIALGAMEPPALVVVGVDEPEKVGFKVFQRLKKGPLAKLPIMLVTGSVAPESFAKHKGLKTHAEEYVDKRTTSHDELASRIDALIGLGAPAEDDLDIPVEIDDINVADGNVIDEEAPPEAEYLQDAATHGRPERIDAAVADDVDDAFAGLMGGDVASSARSSSPVLAEDDLQQVPTPLPLPHPEPDEDVVPQMPTVAQAVPIVTTSSLEPIPGAIEDDAPPDDDFDDFKKDVYPIDDVLDEAPVAQIAATSPVNEPVNRAVIESQPAIPLDSDELEVIGDSDLIEDDGGVPVPVHHPRSADDAAAAAEIQKEASAPRAIPVIPSSGRAPTIDLGLEKVAQQADKEQQSGSYPPAEDRDQSGVYDRRALRKIGELERQVAELKNELERARAAADAAAKGGGREQTFLNLREKMMAADNELKKVRGELTTRERELSDLQARLATVQRQRNDAEDKVSELEERARAEAERAATAVKQERALASSIAGLETELGEKSELYAGAERARAQLEQELARERALRTAHASDAERQLRVEREQLVARHHGELAQLRQELTQQHGSALAHLRQELAQEHAGAISAAVENARAEAAAETKQVIAELDAQRTSELDALRRELAAQRATALAQLRRELADTHAAQLAVAVEAARDEVGAEADRAFARAEAQRDAELATARAEHQAVLGALRAEHQAATSKLRGELERTASRTKSDLEQQLAQVKTEYETLLAHTKSELDSKLAKTQRELESQLADAHAQLDTTNAAHEQALADAAAAHAAELANQANQHAAIMAARERELTTARQEDAIAHTAALHELEVELERAAARYGLELEGARRELDEAFALHAQNKAAIVEEQRAAQARLAAEHADELARAEADKQRAIAEIHKAAAEHKAASDRASEQHRQELAAQREAADREIAELRQLLLGAKRQMEDAAGRAVAEREQLEAAHAQALANQRAQHERAMAAASGEIVKVKAIADADHTRAMASAKADHERAMKALELANAAQLGEVTTERDQLERGLSAARDAIKRTEAELATAIQAIADRNAELRTASSAIAERDARLTELRREVNAIEQENASYQEQVLRAYQKIKSDEAMVARAKKAMAIALTVLDTDAAPKSEPT